MPPTTPPKGRPTPGKIDREAAQRRAARRNTRAKVIWICLALIAVTAIVVLGSGSGGSGTAPTSPGF